MPTLNGSANGDNLVGTSSEDDIFGNGGADTLLGEGGDDTIFGDDNSTALSTPSLDPTVTDNIDDASGTETNNVYATELVTLANGDLIMITSERVTNDDGIASYQIDNDPASAAYGQIMGTNPGNSGHEDVPAKIDSIGSDSGGSVAGYGNIADLAAVTLESGETYVYSADFEAGAIGVTQIGSTGELTQLAAVDTSLTHGIKELTVAEVDGNTFLFALNTDSSSSDELVSYQIGADGSLTVSDIEVDGAGSAENFLNGGSGFGHASLLESFTNSAGETFVVAGGNDDGISLWTANGSGDLTFENARGDNQAGAGETDPQGNSLARDVIQPENTGLIDPAAAAFGEIDGATYLFVGGNADNIEVFRVDTDASGDGTYDLTLVGQTGDVVHDISSMAFLPDGNGGGSLVVGGEQSALEFFNPNVQPNGELVLTQSTILRDATEPGAELLDSEDIDVEGGILVSASDNDDGVAVITTGYNDQFADAPGAGDIIDGGAGDDLLLGEDGSDTIDGGAGQDTIFGDNIGGVVGSAEGVAGLSVTIESQSGAENGSLLAEITGVDGSVEVVTLTNNYDANVGRTFDLDLDNGDSVRLGITSDLLSGPAWSNSGNARIDETTGETAVISFEDGGATDFQDVIVSTTISGPATVLLPDASIGAGFDPLLETSGDDLLDGGTEEDIIYGDDGVAASAPGFDFGGTENVGVLINSQAGLNNGAVLAEITSADGSVRVETLTDSYDGNVGNRFDLGLEAGDSLRVGITAAGRTIWSDEDGAVGSTQTATDEVRLAFEDEGGSDFDDVVLTVDLDGITQLELPGGETLGDVGNVAQYLGDGEGGNDTIIGGEGSDTLFGEGGDDVFVVGSPAEAAGDVVIGGNGPDATTDFDVLDLSGAGEVTIDDAADANDDGATAGTVTFENGATLEFEGIEEILSDDPVDPVPVVVDDAATGAEDTQIEGIDVLENDTAPNGDPLTVVAASAPNGTVNINPDGTLDYLPDPNFNGEDVITYTVNDPAGNSATGEVEIIVDPVADIPDAVEDSAVTDEDTLVTIDVLGNDSDGGNGPIAVTSASALNGAVAINEDGTLAYTPDPGFVGEDTISYTITNAEPESDTATVTVTVTDPTTPDGVVDGEDTGELMDDGYDDGNAPNDGGGDVIGDDDDLVEGNGGDDTIATGPGEDTIDGGTGDDLIDGGDDDDQLNGGEGEDTLLGSGGNDTITPASPEEADGDVVNGGNGPDDALDFDVLDLRGLGPVDIDAEDDPNDIDAERGTVTFEDGEELTFEGIEQILSDGPINEPPVAVDDAAVTDPGTPTIIDVLGNDSDPDGDPLTVEGATAENGTVAVDGDGNLLYIPNAGFEGDDTITYTISDGELTDTAEVAVTVADDNVAPVAVDDTAATDVQTPTIIDVLGNDSDPDGDPLTVESATAENGLVATLADGSLIYIPNAGFQGEDTISYSISDGELTDDAVVTVTVGTDNTAPVANDDVATTPVDTFTLIDVLANDTDAESDPLTVTSATADNGVVAAIPGGPLVYIPDAGFEGEDTISYTVSDGTDTDDAIVSVTVGDPDDNTAPIAVDDTADAVEGTPLTIDVLSNDSDPDGDPLTVTGAIADNGTVAITAGGELLYIPDAGFAGDDTITYTISDGELTADGEVIVNVTDPTQPDGVVDGEDTGEAMLVGYDDGNAPNDGGGDVITEDGDEVDGNGGDDNIQTGGGDDTIDGGEGDDIIGGGADDDEIDGGAGVDTIFGEDGDDTITSESAEEADGDQVFGGNGPDDTTDYDVLDLRGLGPVSIDAEDDPNDTDAELGTVTFEDGETLDFFGIEEILADEPVDQDPTAVDDTASVEEDGVVTIDVLANDSDPQGQPLTVSAPTASNGLVTVNPAGALVYAPNPDFFGTDTLTYTVSDPEGNSDTATVTVEVQPVNDAPIAEDDTASTDEGDSVVIDVLDNDSDVEDGTPDVTSASALNGTVSINSDGSLLYTPDAGFTGEDTISYTVTDSDGATDQGDVFVTVETDVGSNGAVDGADSGEDMDLGYTDDDGDVITGGDDTILGNAGDDTIDGAGGDDLIDGGAGDDQLNGGAGNDTLVDGPGSDVLDGGEGEDTYLDDDGEGHVVVYTDNDGNGSVTHIPTYEVDDFSNIEEFVADEVDGETDKISFEEAIQASEIETAIQGISNDVSGLFFADNGNMVNFGPDGTTLNDILSGATEDGRAGEYFIQDGDEDGSINGLEFSNFEQIFFRVEEDNPVMQLMNQTLDEEDTVEEDAEEDILEEVF